MPLTPEAQRLISVIYRPGAPRLHEMSIEDARFSTTKLYQYFSLPPPEVGEVTEFVMMRTDAPALNSRLYRPLNHPAGTTLPVLIWFHGGGWCLSGLDDYDSVCRTLANESGCAVFAVEYRLAPEASFPAAVEDARFAFEWVADQATLLDIDPEHIALGGDSAGGTLSIVTAIDLHKTNTKQPVFLLLIYPSVDAKSIRPARQRYANGYLLDKESLSWFFSHFAPEENLDDWRISPLHAPSLAGLPPIFMITAEFDPLLDDCIAFRNRVQAQGGCIEHLNAKGLVHGFISLGGLFPEAAPLLTQAAKAMHTHLHPPLP